MICTEYIYSGNIKEQPKSKTFTITKEHYHLYSLFEELYEDVKNCNIFTTNDYNNLARYESEETEQINLENKRRNSNIKKEQDYNQERLFVNDCIEWHCDDFPYNEASIVKIAHEKEKFMVTLEKSKEEDRHLTYAVRFRNSGSRYAPFNALFMRMYNKLIEYEPEYHQVHMEEYLYQHKLEKKR